LGGSTNSLAKANTKLFGADGSNTSTHQEARPIPYFAGNRRLGITWLADGLNIRTRSAGSSKKGGGSSKKYFGDLLFAVCHGPVDRIDEIWMDNYRVWAGPTSRGSEDFASITFNRGSGPCLLRFYWGTEGQTVDEILGVSPPAIGKVARTEYNHPGYRGLCYGVIEQCPLGTGRAAAPQIEVVVGRWPQPAGLTDASYIDADINPMAVLLEWWTNKRFGLGLSTDLLDLRAINAVAAVCTNAGFGLSPLVDRQQPARQMFTELLQYFDAWLRTKAGTLQVGVDIPPDDLDALPVLDESSLAEEPDLKPDGWPQTFNRTTVTYSNRLRHHKESAVTWIDNANLQIVGAPIEQTLARTWITKACTARLAAAAAGQVAGVPQLNGALKPLRSSVTSLFPGDLLKLLYGGAGVPPAGLILRLTEKNLGAAEAAVVDLNFAEDRSALASVLYVSPDEVWAQEQDLESEAIPIANSRMIELPRNLTDDYTITLSPIAARVDVVTDLFNIFRAPSEIGDYKQIGSDPNFAIAGSVAVNYPAATLVIDDFVGLLVDLSPIDGDALVSLAEDDAVLETMLLFVDDEIMSVRDVIPVTSSRVKFLGLVRARADTVRSAHNVGGGVLILSRDQLYSLRKGYFSNGSTHSFKYQPSVAGAPLDMSTIDPLPPYTVTARSRRPLPPINVAINGVLIPSSEGTQGVGAYGTGDDIALAWRLTSWDRPIYGDWFAMWGSPFDDNKVKTYIEIWATTGSPTKPLRRITVQDGIESSIYTNTHLVSDFGSEPMQFQVKIWSSRNGYLSARKQTFTVNKL
jgi:hypothetical protein